MDLQALINNINNVLTNWPLFIYVIGISVICTIAFKFIQFCYLGFAFKRVFASKKQETTAASTDMTPTQAFLNTLSSNLGNGSIAGVATAIFSGGPGAALWMIIFGLLLMSVRFAEVFLSMHYGREADSTTKLGGPMLYLQHVPGGKLLAPIYAAMTLIFGLVAAASVQTNSIRVSLVNTFGQYGLTPFMCAVGITLFILYVLFGGAARIVKVSERIVPLKVIVFFATTLLVLGYHYAMILPALSLIFKSAFTQTAASGALLGFSVQQALRYGMMRSIFATESGLGTAAIFFGFTGSRTPVQDGIVAMLSTFISTIVCFIVALCIVASGVWNTGLNSTALTIASFQSVFGTTIGAWTVSFLSVTFGIGVFVSYAYLTREAWLYLTKGRLAFMFTILYCLFAFGGALIDVKAVWDSADIPQAFMLIINLFAILYLLPVIKKAVVEFNKREHA